MDSIAITPPQMAIDMHRSNLNALMAPKAFLNLIFAGFLLLASFPKVGMAEPQTIRQHCEQFGLNQASMNALLPYVDMGRLVSDVAHERDEQGLNRVIFHLSPDQDLRVELRPKVAVYLDLLPLERQYEIITIRGDRLFQNDLKLSPELSSQHIAVLADQLMDVQNKLYGDAQITLAVVSSHYKGRRMSIDDVYALHIQNGSDSFDMVRYPVDGQYHWFDQNGKSLQRTFLRSPMSYKAVSSKYGIKRGHRRHKGVDFAAIIGVPIRAMADGFVKGAGWKSGYGRVVELSHTQWNGVETLYAHMSKMAVKSGSFVKKGQIIGFNGESGNATGPHLHYELKRNGSQINPKYIPVNPTVTLNAQQEERFWEYRRSIIQAMLRQSPVGSAERQNPFN